MRELEIVERTTAARDAWAQREWAEADALYAAILALPPYANLPEDIA